MERLLAPALGLWMLCACAIPPPPTTPAQIPVDLTGIVMTLLRVQPVLVMTSGGAFTLAQRKAMEADLNIATKALARLSAGMPVEQGRRLARDVVLPLDRTMGLLDGVAFEPRLARWLPVLDAIDAVLPEAEAFAGVPVPVRGRRVPPMTVQQGRQALGIR